MLHFNEMMMMMMMRMMSACTRPTCLVMDLNCPRLLKQQSVSTHVASLILWWFRTNQSPFDQNWLWK